MEAFVKYIEHNLLEKRERLTAVEVNTVARFNIKRKQLIEQLIALLLQKKIILGIVFQKISENIGMHIFIPKDNIEEQCYISKDMCKNGRMICLCENREKNQLGGGESFQFYCRSDIVKYLRYFYFIQHFNFYVMMRIYETKVEDRWGAEKELFINDLTTKFDVAYTFLSEIALPLEFNCEKLVE